MAGHQLKSASITNLDALPAVANTIGEGAPGYETVISDFVLPVSADDTTSTYRLCRIPTNAKIKNLSIYSTLTGAAGDIDIAFSDGADAPPSLAGGVVQITGPVDNKLFGSAQTLALAGVNTDFTFKGTFTPAMMNMPLWAALVSLGATQFTSDPGGCFDIFVKLTTAVTAGGILAAKVNYVE